MAKTSVRGGPALASDAAAWGTSSDPAEWHHEVVTEEFDGIVQADISAFTRGDPVM